MEADKSVEQRKFDMTVKYQAVFGSEDGRDVLKHMMRATHIMNTTLSDSPYETHFKEGERSFLLRILTIMKVDPEQMLSLLEMDNQQGEHNALK